MFGLEYGAGKLFFFQGGRSGKSGLLHRFLMAAPDAATAQAWASEAFGGRDHVGKVFEVTQDELFGFGLGKPAKAGQ